jgi:hypothetical protein
MVTMLVVVAVAIAGIPTAVWLDFLWRERDDITVSTRDVRKVIAIIVIVIVIAVAVAVVVAMSEAIRWNVDGNGHNVTIAKGAGS